MTTAGNAEGREIGEAVSYAIAHGTRIEILAILNEGIRTQAEISRRLSVPLSTLQHHMAELLSSGSIEEVDSRLVGNIVVHRYRALERGEFSTSDYLKMSEESQRTVVGLTLQNAFAEHLASFRAGKMRGDDPNLVVLWDWFNVDKEGEDELTAEMEEAWKRLRSVVARSIDRRNRSGEEPRSIMVSFIGHPRVRPAPGDPPFGSLVETDG